MRRTAGRGSRAPARRHPEAFTLSGLGDGNRFVIEVDSETNRMIVFDSNANGVPVAKLSDLVKDLSIVLGKSEPTVTLIARHLRESGMIATGGRGPGAADMTVTDCVNLLLGAVCSEQAKDAPQVVRAYRAAKGEGYVRGEKGTLEGFARCPEPWAFMVENECELGDVMERLVTGFSNGSLTHVYLNYGNEANDRLARSSEPYNPSIVTMGEEDIGITFEFDITFEITRLFVRDGRESVPLVAVAFHNAFDETGTGRPRARWRRDLVEIRRITTATILHVAKLLAPNHHGCQQ